MTMLYIVLINASTMLSGLAGVTSYIEAGLLFLPFLIQIQPGTDNNHFAVHHCFLDIG
jgi:hypothetical protein